MNHLQELLKGKGWEVRLLMEFTETSDTEGTTSVDIVEKDAAAGKACDGYIVSPEEADELLDNGITMDLSAMIKRAAPSLYLKYRQFFSAKVPGIPASLNFNTKGRPSAFYLSKDVAANANIKAGSLSGVMDMLEQGDPKSQVWANFFDMPGYHPGLLDIWAGEKGYYQLSTYGISGSLYARLDDPECKPFAIETIDGFWEFAGRCRNLIDKGQINDAFFVQTPTDTVVGYIGPLTTVIYHNFLAIHKKIGQDYVAYPLAGFSPPNLPQDNPYTGSVIVVPSTSKKAEQVIGLVQWAFCSPYNYNLVNYGAEGVDYRITDGKFEYLNQGQSITATDWNPDSTMYNICRPNLFMDSLAVQPTVYQAGNYAEAAAAVKPVIPPMWGIVKLRGDTQSCRSVFKDMRANMANIMQNRDDLLSGLVKRIGPAPITPVDCQAELKKLEGDTNRLVEAYQARIKSLMDEQKKS